MRNPLTKPCLFICLLLLATEAIGQTAPSSWSAAKNTSADNVYHDNNRTLCCGCTFQFNTDGSGSLDMAQCHITPLEKYANRTSRIEWEHIVPASLMPARQVSCWTNPEHFVDCISESGKVASGRHCCEKVNQIAKNMIFDLHNLAPAIGQVNAYRGNDRYGEVGDNPPSEVWTGCDVRHLRADNASDHRFEPADCTKGRRCPCLVLHA